MANTYVKEFETWLLMGSWHVDTACKILAGFFPPIINETEVIFSDDHRIQSQGYDSVDDSQQISNGKAPTGAQWKEYNRISALFQSDGHKANLNTMKYTVRPCYAIDWAASKRIQPAWLDEARKEGFPVDMPQSEPMKEKRKAGDDELASRLRLIGVLANMLQDEKIAHEDKQNADAIATYIANNYGIDMPRKGLAKGTVVKALGAAKKRLKEDGVN